MLRIVPQTRAQKAKDYYTTADYYREGAEVAGVWGGRGAAMLGLKGAIEKADFDALCDNLRPDGQGRLTARTRKDRTIGYDFSFSVSKSVSLVYGMCGEGAIRDAFHAAVRETMTDIETEAKSRVRKKGKYANRTTSNLVWGEFIHSTSRPVDGVPDPQLHAHCFVFNATLDPEEQQFKATQFRELKRDSPYWQSAFRARLANKLQALGYELEFSKDDFEIVGISDSVLERFSRRTKEIDDYAKEKGITNPAWKSEVAGKTRKRKIKDLPWDKLVKEWWSRLSPEEADALNAVAKNRRTIEPESREQESVDHALAHCFERASVVSEKQLLAEALSFGLGSVTVKGIEKELGNRLLIRREVEGRVMVTTPEILAEEQRIVAFAREGRGKCRPLVGFDRPIVDRELNGQQQHAVRHLWQSPDRVLLLRGAAGVGKTRLLKEAIAGMQLAGQRVVALAQSADASRGVLRDEAKIASADTVARFLVDEKFQEQARKGVILIDEASLLGTRTMAKVIDKAKQLEARLILVGDENQHGPIERGAAFRLLQEKAALPVAQVTEIQRQKGDYRAAVKALSEGRVLEGFDQLERLGWVEELPGGERGERMAQDYLRITKGRNANGQHRSCLIVAPTNQEARAITEAVRGLLRKAKRLGDDHEVTAWQPVHLTEAERADARNYAPGDMLVFHKAAPGHRTGERLVVEEGTKL